MEVLTFGANAQSTATFSSILDRQTDSILRGRGDIKRKDDTSINTPYLTAPGAEVAAAAGVAGAQNASSDLREVSSA